ncbi:MAG: excinuclease ABC subunit UvrB [Oligoflexales bacterium]
MFKIHAPFKPAGDQPQAIHEITKSFQDGNTHHTLMGVTGSGKTFTMAHTIAALGTSALVIAPNKTLAAQLFVELKEFLNEDNVGFFISYYDYYQPEAYVPGSDTYIAKDSSINDDIDKMRHSTTQMLFEKKQCVVVASVSCIYGLGSPSSYAEMSISLEVGQDLTREKFLRSLVDIQYARNDFQLVRGHFRVRGDIVDVLPANQSDTAIRIEFFGQEIDSILLIDALTGEIVRELETVSLYPNSHYVTDRKDIKMITKEILDDLGKRLRTLEKQNKLVEAQRLEQRTMQDVETMEQIGYCPGIENYSRYLTGNAPGEPPPCLLDYFGKDFLTIIDESHITVAQIGGMFKGDRARKKNLVDFGFRLPSALDNRPLNFEEFLERTPKTLYVSATPGEFEIEKSGLHYSEQIIRPTGLIDPEIEIRPSKGQVDNLLGELRKESEKKGKILITTLTKKMAEELSEYFQEYGIRIRYLHSDIDALERSELIRDLRRDKFDALVGINLLREGLDIPEVSLVAIMDADKEGFLRSRRSLIQTVGRAARNENAQVIFYADKMTPSMKACIEETNRRRDIQSEHNKKHGIIPHTIQKALPQDLRAIYGIQNEENEKKNDTQKHSLLSIEQIEKITRTKTKAMHKAAGSLDFEKAAEIRDEIKSLKEELLIRRENHD